MLQYLKGFWDQVRKVAQDSKAANGYTADCISVIDTNNPKYLILNNIQGMRSDRKRAFLQALNIHCTVLSLYY